MSDKSYFVYFFKTPCRVLNVDKREGDHYLCKIGYTADFEERKKNYDIPFDIQLIEFVEFPDRYTARTCETMLKTMCSPGQRLRQRGKNRRSEWFAYSDEDITCVKRNLSQFHDKNLLTRFIGDAKEINREMASLSRSIQRNVELYDWDYPIKMSDFVIEFDGFKNKQLEMGIVP